MRCRRQNLLTLFLGSCCLLLLYSLLPGAHRDPRDVGEGVMAYRRERYAAALRRPPRDGPGENGSAVVLPPEEQKIADERFHAASFNVYASEKMAMDRSLPDTRHQECRNVQYPADLPTVSVVLIFNNEALNVVLRTVHSVVNRTPPQYLHEVILLDDCSDHEELLENLDRIVAQTWPDGVVKIVRRGTRGGLVKARVSGAKAATGDVLLIMDAHMEVNVGWAEPILSYIQDHPQSLVLPVVDNIRDKDMKYTPGSATAIQGFSWGMLFQWMKAPERLIQEQTKPTDPIRSFTMVGCVFAIQREYFFHIGAFDEGMSIWGGENVELPLRVWMCGGSVYLIPCSRIGHLYRKTHPYTFPEKDTMGHNAKRLAEVWLDDYKRLLYRGRPDLQNKDVGDLSERKALRERLKCHSFKWFLQNIYPEKFIPDENVLAFGKLENEASGLCVDTLSQKQNKPFILGLKQCDRGRKYHQEMSLSRTNEFRMELQCFNGESKTGQINAGNCKGKEIWHYDKATKALKEATSSRCLDVNEAKPNSHVALKPCNESPGQQWTWDNLFF